MSVAPQKPWTIGQFFSWAETQAERYEFDGTQPVAMTGGTVNHGIIMRNLHRSLDAGLRGSPCQPLGPDVGVATVGATIRYPDALVTCAKLVGTSRTVPDAVVIFEIVSPGSSAVDRIVKTREYAAVASVRRYVIVESATKGLLVLHRQNGSDSWTAEALTADDILALPGVAVEIPVAELYADVNFDEPAANEGSA
jgi:Uma2 family endonuclease